MGNYSRKSENIPDRHKTVFFKYIFFEIAKNFKVREEKLPCLIPYGDSINFGIAYVTNKFKLIPFHFFSDVDSMIVFILLS